MRENNTAWRSAETVRRDWLRGFLTAKTAPKDAAVFIAQAVAAGEHPLRRAFERGHPLGRDLLGIRADATEPNAATKLAGLLATASPGRAQVITLGLVLAAYEDATDVHTWRNPDAGSRRYLRYLTAHGYTPSAVEQAVLDSDKPDGSDEPEASDEPDHSDDDQDGASAA